MSFSTVDVPPAASTVAPASSSVPRYVGWFLLLPVFAVMLFAYVWPTVELIGSSLATQAGPGGWDVVFSSWALRHFGNALSYALLPILLLVTIAPGFAWAASRAGLTGRWIARAALALPLAAYAPTGLALVWMSEHRTDPFESTRFDGRGVMLATLGAFVVGAGVICYLAALRRRTPDIRTRRAVLVVGALLVLAAIGYALQQYTFVAMVDNAMSNDERMTTSSPLAVLEFTGGDPQWAPVSVALLLVLAVLGVAAAIMALRSGLVIEFDPARRSADDERARTGASKLAMGGTVAGVLALVAFIVVQLGPWLAGLAAGVSEGAGQAGYGGLLAVFNTTWLITLGTALVQVMMAALGGFAIALARPLGRHSEWLLLGFAPWLFVGNGLMELPRLDPTSDGMQPLLAYGPVSWLSVPALFLFTLFFRGQAGHWTRARMAGEPRPFVRTMWPALPMTGFAVGALWLVQAQDLIVATLADAGDGVVANAQLILSRMAFPLRPEAEPALGYPLVLLVLFTLGGLILQLTYLDRIAVRINRSASTVDDR